jgi:hypothetical protein
MVAAMARALGTLGREIAVGKTRAPMTGKNIWRLCKVYGRMEVLEQHHDLEQVRALLGHARLDTSAVPWIGTTS